MTVFRARTDSFASRSTL